MFGFFATLFGLGVIGVNNMRDTYDEVLERHLAKGANEIAYLDRHNKLRCVKNNHPIEVIGRKWVDAYTREVLCDPEGDELKAQIASMKEYEKECIERDEKNKENAINNNERFYETCVHRAGFVKYDTVFFEINDRYKYHTLYKRVKDDLVCVKFEWMRGIIGYEKNQYPGYKEIRYGFFVEPSFYYIGDKAKYRRNLNHEKIEWLYDAYLESISKNVQLFDKIKNESVVEYIKKYNIPLSPVSKEAFVVVYVKEGKNKYDSYWFE